MEPSMLLLLMFCRNDIHFQALFFCAPHVDKHFCLTQSFVPTLRDRLAGTKEDRRIPLSFINVYITRANELP